MVLANIRLLFLRLHIHPSLSFFPRGYIPAFSLRYIAPQYANSSRSYFIAYRLNYIIVLHKLIPLFLLFSLSLSFLFPASSTFPISYDTFLCDCTSPHTRSYNCVFCVCTTFSDFHIFPRFLFSLLAIICSNFRELPSSQRSNTDAEY